jgi:hypothetical protein
MKAFVLAAVVFLVVACQSLPVNAGGAGGGYKAAGVPETPTRTVYSNRHGISFTYPKGWHIEDPTLNYKNLDAAEAEGGAYIQVYSYDSTLAADPTSSVPVSEAKIMITVSRNKDKIDYPMLLGGLGNDVLAKTAFSIDGKTAYKMHYRILNQETGGKLDVLSILLIDGGYVVRFICYPWNSRHVSQFDELAQSFHASWS